MEAYCASCGEDRAMQIVNRREAYPVRGESVAINAQVAHCQTCGTDVSVPSLDDANLRSAFDHYRSAHGLLTAEDIVQLRERYGLSQRSLANLLGWGLVTIQRYENGGIQDIAHDQILRSLSNPDEVRRYLARPECRLSFRQIRRLQERIDQPRVTWDQVKTDISNAVRREGLMQGFRLLDIERLEQVVLWFAYNVSDLSKTKLAKLLWLADFSHFRHERLSLTGLAYAHAPYGPMPHNFQLLLGLMESDGAIRLNEVDESDPRRTVVEPQDALDRQFFSSSELATLQHIAERFGSRRAVELSEQSHREPAWARRNNGETIPYSEADSVVMLDF